MLECCNAFTRLFLDYVAAGSEIANFTNYDVFEEVSEDSLPTWNKQRGSAAEVIDMMWVLVKKYNELREFIKCKARGTVR